VGVNIKKKGGEAHMIILEYFCLMEFSENSYAVFYDPELYQFCDGDAPILWCDKKNIYYFFREPNNL
jgi:hypothetical protein